MEVSQVMRKAIIIDDHVLLKEAAKIMANKNIGSLIIINNNKIKGILTEKDVIKNVANLNSPVKKIMSKKVVEIAPETSIEEAINQMIENKVKRLPVVQDKKLVGIVTTTDVLAHYEGDFNEGDFIFN